MFGIRPDKSHVQQYGAGRFLALADAIGHFPSEKVRGMFNC